MYSELRAWDLHWSACLLCTGTTQGRSLCPSLQSYVYILWGGEKKALGYMHLLAIS